MTALPPAPPPEPADDAWLAEHYPDHVGAVRVYGPGFASKAAGLYQELRRTHGRVAPVLLDADVPAWLLLSYREVHLVTSNPGLFGKDSRRWNAWERVPRNWSLMPYVGWTAGVHFTEGAEHRRRAGAIGDALDAVDRIQFAAICEQVADQLIDQFAGNGSSDLITQYSHQIPMRVIARLYGLPQADIPALVRDIADSLVEGEDADANAAHQRIRARIGQLVKDKRDHPGQDVPSRMLAHPARLTDEEVAVDLLLLCIGAQPTGDWIGNTLRLMLIDDQFSLTLQGGRASAEQALNEVLWKDTPTQNFIGRWAVQDCELGGRYIRRGDLLVMGLAAANADPQVYPGSFTDPGVNRAHMSFGHGEYGCPFPAPELAEVIARVAVEVLLDRIPDAELAVPPGALEWKQSVWMRGLESLPVRFTPVTAITPVGR